MEKIISAAKLVLGTIFKQNNFLHVCFKNANVFMLSYFEPNNDSTGKMFFFFFFFFFFFCKFWSGDYFRETKIRFLAAIVKRNIFVEVFLLIYGCFRCIQIWCKFCTEIPTGKYLKMNGSKWTPFVHKRK